MATHKKKQTRTRDFEIPKDFVKTFLEHLEDTELEYTLSEVDEDENLIIEVEYSEDEREDVMNLIELLDEYLEENEDKENDEED